MKMIDVSEMECEPRFERLYICLDALKRGFKEVCRLVVCLDGCHLKSIHNGQLLSAIGINANNSMYPVAYVVVKMEGTTT